jgi:hypothetical protein
MQADRHDAARMGTLEVECVKLPADHTFELVRRAAGTQDLGQVPGAWAPSNSVSQGGET